jgi:hypothetical protein
MPSPPVRVEAKEGKTIQECIDNEIKKLRTRYIADGYIDIPDWAWNKGHSSEEQERCVFSYIKDHESKEIKPMGCYDGNKYPVIKYEKFLKKDPLTSLLISPKIDGIRATCQVVNGEVEFRTKSGKLIKSLDHLKDNIFLKAAEYPLDGEIYIYGKSLQYIKGLAKRQYSDDETSQLEFWLFDEVSEFAAMVRRMNINNQFKKYMEDHLYAGCVDNVVLVETIITKEWNKIHDYEADFISKGYEGCVVRTSHGWYAQGKKGQQMVKYKPYQDDEFDVLGTQDGRRPEDYVVVCRTKGGEMFNAKPMGTVEERMALYDDIMTVTDRPRKGTVKYFTLSEKGIPTQPQFKCIRDDGD